MVWKDWTMIGVKNCFTTVFAADIVIVDTG